MPNPFSTDARDQARHILSGPPYRTSPSHPPRPLAGFLHTLGHWLFDAVGHPAEWLYHHLLLHIGHGFHAAFGSFWPVPVAVLSVGFGAFVGVVLVRRRSRIAAAARPTSPSVRAIGADELDVQADRAEADTDHQRAVRLRFQAGLLRLAARGVISHAEVRTDRQLIELVRSTTFDGLAHQHEAIVFGGVVATADDAASSRRDWPRVLTEAKTLVGAAATVPSTASAVTSAPRPPVGPPGAAPGRGSGLR